MPIGIEADCPVVENIAVAADTFSRQERLPENVARRVLRLGHDPYSKMGGPLEAATARYGPRRGGCPHLPGRVKPGSFLEPRNWRALLACPDEGVRVYVFCGAGGAGLPDHIQPGTLEDPGNLLFGLSQGPVRNPSVVINRNNYPWTVIGL
jgi:hypothetical protein